MTVPLAACSAGFICDVVCEDGAVNVGPKRLEFLSAGEREERVWERRRTIHCS